MLAMAVAMGIGRFVYTPLLPGMMEGLGQSASDAGLIASANYAGYLVGALLAGGGWGEGRERAVGLWSLAASALLVALMAPSRRLPAFLALRFLAGVASAFVMVFVTSLVFARLAANGRDDLQGFISAASAWASRPPPS
jgi:predicted MFS family arabinose efflux permease